MSKHEWIIWGLIIALHIVIIATGAMVMMVAISG